MANLDFTNIQLSDSGYYHCVASNACGMKLRPMIKLEVENCNGIDDNNANANLAIIRYGNNGRFMVKSIHPHIVGAAVS